MAELEAECKALQAASQTDKDARVKAEERADRLLAAKKRLQENEEAMRTDISMLEVSHYAEP